RGRSPPARGTRAARPIPVADAPARSRRREEWRRAGAGWTPLTRWESSHGLGRGAACCAPTCCMLGATSSGRYFFWALLLEERLERGPEIGCGAADRVDVRPEPDAVLETHPVELVELLL